MGVEGDRAPAKAERPIGAEARNGLGENGTKAAMAMRAGEMDVWRVEGAVDEGSGKSEWSLM